MKLIHKTKVLSGMFIQQNLYRHDGLLAVPKGFMINQREKEIINYYDYEFLLVEEKYKVSYNRTDINNILNIIEHTLRNNLLWGFEFGEVLYDEVANIIFENRNRIKELEKFNNLSSYQFTHYLNTAIIVISILTENRIENINKKVAEIFFLTMMHEIGLIVVEEEIDRKNKNTITSEEFMQIKNASEITIKRAKKMGFNPYEIKFLEEIDENWDGTGFKKYKSEEIEDLAQLISIASKYDEMSLYKVNEKKQTVQFIYKYLLNEKGKKFNPKIVELFLKRFRPYKTNMQVELSDGTKGEIKVIKNETNFMPIVEVEGRMIDISSAGIEIKKVEEYI